MAWGRSAAIASSESTAPRGLPGRFTMMVLPRIAATARERIARDVFFKPSARICSANPGINRSAIAMVASGVTSRGPTPVPPVVSIKSASFESAAFFRCAEMPSRSSGRTAASTICQPSSRHRPATAGPELSSYFWLATESLTVRMETRMAWRICGLTFGYFGVFIRAVALAFVHQSQRFH
jgi:hypothetical protein